MQSPLKLQNLTTSITILSPITSSHLIFHILLTIHWSFTNPPS